MIDISGSLVEACRLEGTVELSDKGLFSFLVVEYTAVLLCLIHMVVVPGTCVDPLTVCGLTVNVWWDPFAVTEIGLVLLLSRNNTQFRES